MALNKCVHFKFIVVLTLCQIISCTVSGKQLLNSISKSQKNASAGIRRVNDMKYKDIPVLSDLSDYLRVIKDSNSFSKGHLNDIDLNYVFGLFVINVNLKAALLQKYEVPVTTLKEIEGIINETTDLLVFFFSMVKLDKDPNDLRYKHISSLFSNPDEWAERLRPFSRSAEVDPMWQNSDRFTSWSKYKKMMTQNPGLPGPTESDFCVTSMVTHVVTRTSTRTVCTLDKTCYLMLLKGGNIGYSFTHRLLLIMAARLARGCAIFSEDEDMELIIRICSNMYSEAEFIVNNKNNEQFIDLLAEQITVCSLAGFSEFLHRSWLNIIIQHQTNEGCFGIGSDEQDVFQRNIIKGETKQWVMIKDVGQHSLRDGKCDGHLTAVAAACLAAGVRLIMALTDSTITNSTNV